MILEADKVTSRVRVVEPQIENPLGVGKHVIEVDDRVAVDKIGVVMRRDTRLRQGNAQQGFDPSAKGEDSWQEFLGGRQSGIGAIQISEMCLSFVPAARSAKWGRRLVDEHDAAPSPGKLERYRTAHDAGSEDGNDGDVLGSPSAGHFAAASLSKMPASMEATRSSIAPIHSVSSSSQAASAASRVAVASKGWSSVGSARSQSFAFACWS